MIGHKGDWWVYLLADVVAVAIIFGLGLWIAPMLFTLFVGGL